MNEKISEILAKIKARTGVDLTQYPEIKSFQCLETGGTGLFFNQVSSADNPEDEGTIYAATIESDGNYEIATNPQQRMSIISELDLS